jgi:uncharacterized protein (TIGR03435 family)
LSGPQSVRGWEGGPGTSDPVQYSFGKATLLDFIAVAYSVDDSTRISSATPLDEQRFDLVAKIPQGATKEQFRAMRRCSWSGFICGRTSFRRSSQSSS